MEKATAPAYTKTYVEQAINRYDANGRAATLDYYSTMESVNGDLYLFVLDENCEVIVNPALPNNIGMDMRGSLGTDITGKNFGAEFVTVDETGKWIDYVYLNPDDDFNYERKHAWIVRHDNLIFGSGWYEREVSLESTPSAYARALVEQAVARHDAEGKDATLVRYNDPASVDGQYYVLIIDSSDLRAVANGARPDLVGTIPDRIDPTGYYYGSDIASATEEGKWISYVILNPETGEEQRKHTWITLHDGLVFGSGYYEPTSASMQSSDDEEEKVLTILYWQAPSLPGPYLVAGNKDTDAGAVTLEPLASYDPDGELTPRLAAEIPTLENGGISEDLMSITWKLRQGLKWSDGADFTADDVVFTWRYCTDEETGCTGENAFSGIESVNAIDDLTVRIEFDAPVPTHTRPSSAQARQLLAAHSSQNASALQQEIATSRTSRRWEQALTASPSLRQTKAQSMSATHSTGAKRPTSTGLSSRVAETQSPQQGQCSKLTKPIMPGTCRWTRTLWQIWKPPDRAASSPHFPALLSAS